jgi:hypothetical protein
MDLIAHLLLRQDCSNVKYTGMLVGEELSPVKQIDPLLTVMDLSVSHETVEMHREKRLCSP